MSSIRAAEFEDWFAFRWFVTCVPSVTVCLFPLVIGRLFSVIVAISGHLFFLIVKYQPFFFNSFVNVGMLRLAVQPT